MRYRIFILKFILLLSTTLQAQSYGNEWIDYNQQYYAIPVVERGVYRIDYNTMQQAGMPLGSFDPRSFQVFVKGEEQPIFVKNENTGVFSPGDYIEFYGEKNTGWFDEGFYENSDNQPNPNYSLINDTITYYLTWNNLLTNKRYSVQEDDNFEGYSPAAWFWHTQREDYTAGYYAGETNNYGVTQPHYTQAEGWFSGALNLGQSRTKNIATPHIYTAGPDAQVEMAVAGASNYRLLDPDHHLQIQFAGQLIDTLYDGYKLLRFHEQVASNNLNASGTPFVFSSVNSLGTPVDRSAIAYISVRYPRLFNLGGQDNFKLELPPSAGDKSLIAFSGLEAQDDDTVWVYNLTNSTKSKAFAAEEGYKALVSNPTQLRELFITSSGQTRPIISLKPVSADPSNYARFKDFMAPENFNSNYLMISHEKLMDEAQQFKNFRNTTGYKVLLVDVEELYHQFAYGIKKHPLAIRNFAKFTLENYDEQVRKLFLVGKTRPASSYRRNNSFYAASLVPSLGNPPSDVLITSGLDNYGYAPAVATGRLAAQTPDDVSLYLNKVIQHHNAQQTPQEWMKKILHFGGGSNVNEQNVLASYLRQYRSTMEDTLFGGHVKTFLKSSTDPIQINQSDSLRQIINNGVGFMTFFGHAAGVGFDISIDYPSEYSNYGRYPFLVANSCFAGDIFSGSINSSEEFVLIEEKGTIGYLSATTAMGAFELNRYSNEFFRQVSAKSYGKPVGHMIRETIRNTQTPNQYVRNVSLLKTLHGDPAVTLNAQPKPDYKVESSDIFFTPSDVTTELDSFTVHVISTNLGKAIRDSMFVDLERRFPDGSEETYQRKVATTLFKDTLGFRMPVDRERGVGVNQFTVTLDALSQIEEMDVTNNLASTTLFIKSSDIIPVSPHDYAIVSEPSVTLKASTGDPFVGEKTYVFQVDTTPDFSNPLSETSLLHSGGVVSWTPPLNLTDSMVYFWRVSIDSVYTGEYVWRNSSFQHIEGVEGWSQANFFQFERNQHTFVSFNKQERKWEFINSVNSIQAQTGIYPYLEWTEQYIRKNGIPIELFSCLADVGNGMYFAIFDPVSSEHWITHNQGNNLGEYDNYHCRVRPHGTFDYYSTSELWRDRMEAFIDTIPEGHYVLAASHRNHNAENYPESLYQAFETLGSANIRNLENNTPYLLFGKKGNTVGSSNEVIGSGITSVIQLNDSIITNWDKGSMLSQKIGPASKWESVHWKQDSYDQLDTDSVWLNIIGVTAAGLKDTLMTRIPPEQESIDLNNEVDASEYPFLQLMVNMMDEENRTPAQMNYLKAIYEGIPETAIDPSLHYVFERDTVQEGEKILFSTAIHNISEYDMDSLLITYYVMDENRQMHPVEYPRQGPHPAGDVLKDTIMIPTRGIAGHNSLWMEVNPGNDQLEQHFFNNVGQIPFFVEKDKTNPLLEVTFDGMQIMDGDIVSAEPFIHITLRDENPFLALTDTTLVKVYLSTPTNPDWERVYFTTKGQENMRFYPAEMPDNTCTIEFEPVFEVDGDYAIRVQATDESLNESGDYDYVINFEVITRSTITEVLNWPNPFSTATHFVFTLTGSQVPSFMKIQIMTITGKVVREIDLAELGPIRIGRNITTYAWDGTDEYGDRLANGVYLYRVITNIEGEQIELNPTEASRYFHEGFGKMYLIR